MKLNEYFSKQKEINASEMQKFFIYEKFLSKSNKTSLTSRVGFFMRVGIYSVFLLFLFYSFFNPAIFISQPQYDTYEVKDGYVVKHTQENPFTVHADFVGKVIEAKGDFKIINNGVEKETDLISDGDNVLLTSKSELKFEINSGAIAIIKGPAEFNIKYVGESDGINNYIVNLVHGDYFEIKSTQTKTDNIIIKTDDFELESQIDSELDIQITTDGDDKIIDNKGGDVVVKKVINNKKTLTSIPKDQIAKVDEEVRLLEEINEIKKEISSQSLSLTYELIPSVSSEQAETSTGTNLELEESVSLDMVLNSENIKLVITESDLEFLNETLQKSFVRKDIKNIAITYLEGSKSGFEISANNYNNKIQEVYSHFGFELDSRTFAAKLAKGHLDIQDLEMITDQLIAKIEKKYYLPENYLDVLHKALAWIVLLENSEFGKYSGKEIEFEKVLGMLGLEDFTQSLTF